MNEYCLFNSVEWNKSFSKMFPIVLFFNDYEAVIWGTLLLIAFILHVVTWFYDLIVGML